MTPHASSEATSSGTKSGTTASCETSTTTCSAKAPVFMATCTGSPSVVWSRSACVDRELGLAQVRLSSHAEEAPAAGADQTDHHPVAGAHGFDAHAHRLHDARRLVAVDGRKLAAPRAFGEVDVAVADRAGGDFDADLTGLGRVEQEVLDRERRAERPADCGFHGAGAGGKRDCWSRAATSMVFLVYCDSAGRDWLEVPGLVRAELERAEDRESRLLALPDVALDRLEIPASRRPRLETHARSSRAPGSSARLTSSSGSRRDVEELIGVARRVDELPAAAADHDHGAEDALGEVLAAIPSRPGSRAHPPTAGRDCGRRPRGRVASERPGLARSARVGTRSASETGSCTRRGANRPGA